MLKSVIRKNKDYPDGTPCNEWRIIDLKEYYPHKTGNCRTHNPLCRVPLNDKAKYEEGTCNNDRLSNESNRIHKDKDSRKEQPPNTQGFILLLSTSPVSMSAPDTDRNANGRLGTNPTMMILTPKCQEQESH